MNSRNDFVIRKPRDRFRNLGWLGCTLMSLCFWGAGGCKEEVQPLAEKPAPAKVENPVKESQLNQLVLTPEAEARLGVQTVSAVYKEMKPLLRLSGEVMTPPGSLITVVAPLAGTLDRQGFKNSLRAGEAVSKDEALFRLFPLEMELRGRSPLAEAEGQLAMARAQKEAALLKVTRAKALLETRAGSEKALEAAEAELAQSEVAGKGALDQIEYLRENPLEAGKGLTINSPQKGIITRAFAVAGQSVAAGTPLAEVLDSSTLWVRVPVYVGDLNSVDSKEPALIRGLDPHQKDLELEARPVSAPPTADVSSSTVDLYFQISGSGTRLLPGQRVGVGLRLLGSEESLTVPWSAVLFDAQGGTWLYVKAADQTYARRRVSVGRVEGELALISSGLEEGSQVVSEGAAELFGSEFGTGK